MSAAARVAAEKSSAAFTGDLSGRLKTAPGEGEGRRGHRVSMLLR
jgi:hypothetical protein